jgi:hypothetical protein
VTTTYTLTVTNCLTSVQTQTTVTVSTAGGNSVLDELVFSRDYLPGTTDTAGRFMGGTETGTLTGHNGKLFAAMGSWKDTPGSDPAVPAQILVKDAPDSAWRGDFSFGELSLYSTESMASITFTTDANGQALSAPVTLLMASASYPPDPGAPGAIWIRDDAIGTWTRTLDALGAITARVIFSHRDRVTGIHHVFSGMRDGTIYRGSYDPSAPGKVRWNMVPEVTSSSGARFISAAVANGKAYAASGVDIAPGSGITGGLFERTDGVTPSWRVVYQWPVPTNSKSASMRGLTAVPDPAGGSHEVLIAGREAEGIIERIDPTRNYAAVVEFDFAAYYTQLWGGLGGSATLAAYNDMPRATDPRTGTEVRLIGLWVNHPQRQTPPYNGSYYMVRHSNGTYEHGRVFDSAQPVPQGQELRATRSIAASPFVADGGRVFYFGGYDAGGNSPPETTYHNTAWIYRGRVP